MPDPGTIWLYHSLKRQTPKAHYPTCRFFNHGAGIGGQFGASGYWIAFKTLDEALARGEQVTHGGAFVCRECIGERNFWRGGL